MPAICRYYHSTCNAQLSRGPEVLPLQPIVPEARSASGTINMPIPTLFFPICKTIIALLGKECKEKSA